MLAAIRHGLENLLNFSGRDARQAFWYYLLFVYVVTMAIMLVVIVPTMIQGFADSIRQGIAAGQSGDPMASQLAIEAGIGQAMSDMMASTMWVGMLTNGLMLALLAASVVRRLHDSDLSGWWALIPGAIHIANIILAPMLTRRILENMSRISEGDPAANMQAMQTSASGASLLGWAAIIAVVVLGIRKSTPGPNRYGEASFTA